MEIIEETATKIVAKDLLDIQEISLDNIVRRIDIITRSMLADAATLDPKNAESIMGRDKEVNRLSLLGFRTARAATDNPRLLKLFNTNYWNVMIAKQVITYLERFADQVKRVMRTAATEKLDAKLRTELLRMIKAFSERYLAIMKIYYEKNKAASFKAETAARALLKDCESLIKNHHSVTVAKLVEYFQHMVGSMKGILRNVMEQD
jgi:phosphate uptake regulator